MKRSLVKLSVVASCLLVSFAFACLAGGKASSWTLKPIKGNVKGWEKGENWTHRTGNPLKDDGASWSLGYQSGKDPALEMVPKKMVVGSADNGYTKAWTAAKGDGNHMYRGNTLYAGCPEGIRLGPATVLSFDAKLTGNYTIDLQGLLHIQTPDAGAAKLVIYTLDSRGRKPKVLEVSESEIGAGGAGKTIQWTKDVRLQKGMELRFRLQTHNPGPGNGGVAKLKIAKLRITRKQ